MKQKTLYPKTIRYATSNLIITEKLDGSNIGFFKLNNQLLIAQRNNVYFESELDNQISYKGLKDWLNTFGETLKNELLEGSGIFGEWLGMGQIKYGETELNKRFYIFAKANINDNFEIRNLNYNSELFIYPFQSKKIPFFIGIVPNVYSGNIVLTLDFLNGLYDGYCVIVKRKVEGFVINNNNSIQKYIRYKEGKFEEHKSKGD
jgi:hypothetical protein